MKTLTLSASQEFGIFGPLEILRLQKTEPSGWGYDDARQAATATSVRTQPLPCSASRILLPAEESFRPKPGPHRHGWLHSSRNTSRLHQARYTSLEHRSSTCMSSPEP